MKRANGTIYYRVDYRFPRTARGKRHRISADSLWEAIAIGEMVQKELRAGRDPQTDNLLANYISEKSAALAGDIELGVLGFKKVLDEVRLCLRRHAEFMAKHR